MFHEINLAAALVYALVTTFTPGPNNITSASMGVLHGYRKTLPFLMGLVTGFVAIMLVCGLISTALMALLPGVEQWLHWFGAAYILWLAWHVWRSSMSSDSQAQEVLGFGRGLMLVLLNPKVIIYGLAMYGTFLAPLAHETALRILSAFVLTFIGFCAISTWTLFGTVIHTWLQKPAVARVVNAVLALLLVYTAVDMAGLI